MQVKWEERDSYVETQEIFTKKDDKEKTGGGEEMSKLYELWSVMGEEAEDVNKEVQAEII